MMENNNSLEELFTEFSALLGNIKSPPITPWASFFGIFNVPNKDGIVQRINCNYEGFKVNYLTIILVIVLLAILLHPLLLIQTLFCLGLFGYVYASRNKPLNLGPTLVFGSKEKLACASIVSLLLLSLTGSITRMFWAVLLGATVCITHAIFRKESADGKKNDHYPEATLNAVEEGASVLKGGIQDENTSRLRKKTGK